MTVAALLMIAQVVAGTPPASPPAPATPEAGDLRCLAAFADLTARPGDAAQAGRYGTLFFYGRLVGRDPALDLAAALPGAARAIAGRVDAELARCGRELTVAGNALATAGAAAARPPAR